MASQFPHRKQYTTPAPHLVAGSPHPRTRQPLGPAALVRAPPFPTDISPLYSSHPDEKMTPLTRHHGHVKPLYSPSPTSSSMPSLSPVTPSGASDASPIKLAGIQPPAPFIGPYPIGYINKEPVPAEDNYGRDDPSDLRRPNRQGASSCNPWDYVAAAREGEDGEEGKGKVRRRFTKRELEALEVLWSISKSPTKYQRQRLGAWLGVKTKHITVWFQNRRQEEKRHSREGGSQPQTTSRSNRGTYDPVTGKWRPVPLSCISSLQPPPAEKLAAIQAISLGQYTREYYFDQFPQDDRPMARPSNTVRIPRTASSSLDEILQAREVGFGEQRKMFRREGEVAFRGEGEERNREMLALMPSDPPSSDPVEEDEGEDEGEDNPSRRLKPVLGLGRPSFISRTSSNGRATSLDILASSSRAKQLVLPGPPRSVSGPASFLGHAMAGKRALEPDDNDSSKRSRIHRQGAYPTFRQRDSFSRSSSARTAATPFTPVTRTPGLTRSYSLSSTSSLISIAESSFYLNSGKSVYTPIPTKRGPDEADKEVLNAANKLLQMLGGDR